MEHSTRSHAPRLTRRAALRGAATGAAGLSAGLLLGFQQSEATEDRGLGRMTAYTRPHRDLYGGIPLLADRERLSALIRFAKGYDLVLSALTASVGGFDALQQWESRAAIGADVGNPALAALIELSSIGRVLLRHHELPGARDLCRAPVVRFTTDDGRYQYRCDHEQWAHVEGVCLRCADDQPDEPDYWTPVFEGQVVRARHDFEARS